jgi:flagellar biogenesis protein FliO
MKSMPKWLLIPPVVALLVVLGPLSMQGGTTARASTNEAAAQQPEVAGAQPAQGTRTNRLAITAPRSPDLWQMSSALVGVLLLGVVGVMLLRKLRGGAAPTRGSTLATLRQTLRLSARQAVHAIEFDDRILLIGEHERGLVLLDSGKLPERAADEAEVLARHVDILHRADDEDEGATPRNLLIPRPETPPPARIPTPPATAAAKRATPGLNDFRTLLQKVGRA